MRGNLHFPSLIFSINTQIKHNFIQEKEIDFSPALNSVSKSSS